ncbi:hypothetical protein NDI44_08670 [Trichocoleus sp. DQ-A3]|uniref:hypothetical protein n=1 Tax=Cyanophyceae TaxID=3028117 RepID=UPI001686A80E|nr:hypothetical protein [Coleofasciculus sp. FACHB-125]MBD1899264.1 hypothetical protein [Coleofasciculus sp. FACHB-125]
MPYGERRLVGVDIKGMPGVRYAFRTDVSTGTSTALGHQEIIGASGGFVPGVVFGANSPKPPTARKFFGTAGKGYESSFVDDGSIATARAAGWEIKAGSIAGFRGAAGFVRSVFVPYRPFGATTAINYAWKMPLYQYNKLTTTDKTALGIEDVTNNNYTTVLFGINNPKPNRANKRVSTTDGQVISITTFVAAAKEDTVGDNNSGWKLVGAGGGGIPFGL